MKLFKVSYLAPIDKSLDNYNLEYYYQNFKIQNVSYKAYSVSYLCYGTTSILNMYYANRIIVNFWINDFVWL